ncbi:MAG: radical SAM protein [Chloroflexi bacterium]|nr:radical SAM protein [Chloroflexota bacterium]
MNGEAFRPAYLDLLASGELERRVQIARRGLDRCIACGWECGVERSAGKLGVCRAGVRARVSSYGAHMGEEAPLSGRRGSGTVFFSGCNLRCQYCQNEIISQRMMGDELSAEELAGIFLELQSLGCHNLNLVSPSHVVSPILEAVWLAAQNGLRLPIVYNSGGYDALCALGWLDGVVDIYMPDMKYASAQTARYYSKIPNYPLVNQAAVREMHRQVGDLKLGADGLAKRGLLVRHLVLPHSLAGTAEIARFVAEEISPHTALNVMAQYHPSFNARQFPRLNRRITTQEYQEALEAVCAAGLQPMEAPNLAYREAT